MSKRPASGAKASLDRERRARARRLESVRRLYEEALAARPDGDFVKFVEFIARFRRLSPFNASLVYAQRPGAAMVESKARWEALGRRVLPDAVPIVILMPFGPVQWVYELGDTEGPPVPGSEASPLKATGAAEEGAFEELAALGKALGAVIEDGPYGALLAGTAASLQQHRDRIQRGGSVQHPFWRIRLNGRLDQPSRFATLAHELGHVCCGHLGAHPRGYWDDRRALDKPLKEIEAETVSYLLSARRGISTRSADYLRDYLTAGNITQPDIGRILVTVDLLEGRLGVGDAPASRERRPGPVTGQLSMF